MGRRRIIAAATLAVALQAAVAATAPAGAGYDITAAEKAACTADAIRYCAGTYPDEVRLLACMNANRASLGETCGRAFDAGKAARGLH